MQHRFKGQLSFIWLFYESKFLKYIINYIYIYYIYNINISFHKTDQILSFLKHSCKCRYKISATKCFWEFVKKIIRFFQLILLKNFWSLKRSFYNNNIYNEFNYIPADNKILCTFAWQFFTVNVLFPVHEFDTILIIHT